MSLQRVVVVGRWANPDGSTPTGRLTMQPTSVFTVDDETTAAAAPLHSWIVDGAVSVEAYAGDYFVMEDVVGAAPRSYSFTVPSTPVGSRSIADGVLVASGAHGVLTSATAAFTGGDVGAYVTGDGVPALTTIVAVNSGTTVQLSQPVEDATGVAVLIGARVELAA